MQIRNAVIITDAKTELNLRVNELEDFTGNIVYDRDNLPVDLIRRLYDAVGRSSDDRPTHLEGAAIKSELVR
jgi:hypothetical protein